MPYITLRGTLSQSSLDALHEPSCEIGLIETLVHPVSCCLHAMLYTASTIYSTTQKSKSSFSTRTRDHSWSGARCGFSASPCHLAQLVHRHKPWPQAGWVPGASMPLLGSSDVSPYTNSPLPLKPTHGTKQKRSRSVVKQRDYASRHDHDDYDTCNPRIPQAPKPTEEQLLLL